MFDTIIRAGTVIDGSGDPARTADVGIKDGRIAAIGTLKESARETIDADGALVTPGFIDLHTHYDGQFLWDDRMDPSFSHGVTTAIGGNCGVGFAPVAEHRKELIELMEGVEDVPEIVLDEGLDWSWRTFPEYLDKLAARHYAMDIAIHITHAPLRVYVMGERALRQERATAEDLQAMGALVKEAMAAGAVGFSAGRLLEHLSSKGETVPGAFAEDEEFTALATAMGAGGFGTFQYIPRGAVGTTPQNEIDEVLRRGEHDRIVRLARASGRPLTYSLAQFASDPDDYWMMLDLTDRATAEGLDVRPQIPVKAQGMISTLDSYHVFIRRPSYLKIAHLPRSERAAAMRDPEVRARILAEADDADLYSDNPFVRSMLDQMKAGLSQTYLPSSALDIEPEPARMVAVLAQECGKSPEEFIYDHYSQGDGANSNLSAVFNYPLKSLDHISKTLKYPNTVCGLGDGGAHMRMICDAPLPTLLLAYWARDRKRGPRIPLELAVRKLSGEPAELYGLSDRGHLAVGRRANINIIDYDNLNLGDPVIHFDLPSGAGRLLQRSQGYLGTMVAGVLTRRHDEDTGARPGRLIRAGRRSARVGRWVFGG